MVCSIMQTFCDKSMFKLIDLIVEYSYICIENSHYLVISYDIEIVIEKME